MSLHATFNSSAADADGSPLSGSSFVLPSASHPSYSSLKLVVLNGMDEVEAWSDAVVLMFIQAKILGDLMGLKRTCVVFLCMRVLLLLRRRPTGRVFFDLECWRSSSLLACTSQERMYPFLLSFLLTKCTSDLHA